MRYAEDQAQAEKMLAESAGNAPIYRLGQLSPDYALVYSQNGKVIRFAKKRNGVIYGRGRILIN